MDKLFNQTLPSIVTIKYAPITNSDYSNNELKVFSICLNVLTIIGILFHSFVLFRLVSQQLKSRFYSNRINNSKNNSAISFSSNYKNYVTFAFVSHQIVIDLLRLVYALFYSNSLLIDSKRYLNVTDRSNEIVILNASFTNVNMQTFYEKYCSQMALFYSILTMVTIINILTILISETCRFYDLKLSSSDTSSFSCILFGVALIWISSLIIISSLMLVGIADSAAPTYKCNLNESESPTRSLVINIVWFLLVSFVIVIAFSYSISLYKELTTLNYHHRLSLFAPNLFTISQKPDSRFLNRHVRIVDETAKRLNIFVLLIGVFCFTFLPNFIMTLLKNIVDTKQITLKPYNLIASIINLINPTLNSVVLLVLCIKSNDSILLKQLSFDEDDDDKNENKRFKAILVYLLCHAPFLKFLSSNNKNKTNDLYVNDEQENEDEENSGELKVKCSEEQDVEFIIKDCNTLCKAALHGDLEHESYNKPSKSTTQSNKNYYSSMNNMNEFYSKVGNRLGNNVNQQ